ncbi:MAG: FAD-binding monooxygenase [Proteobacteria bacterium]|nr:MAG: FAD-binding monooxygenase [Pseudomonadota bacterium]
MSKKILITGASVAGCTAAWWLSKRGFEVEVVERADAFRTGGQNVDVRGAGREVIRLMGLESKAFALSTNELGTDWVDEQDLTIARFEVDDKTDRGPTAEMEIRRGDIAKLIYDACPTDVEYRFGDSVVTVKESDAEVVVEFASRKVCAYDYLIVAEGVGSRTRELVFPGENEPRYMDLTIAYYSSPGNSGDSKFARQYNTTDGKGACVKPNRDKDLGTYIGIHGKSDADHDWNIGQQKAYIQQKFGDLGWEFPRLLKAMHETEDFYFDILRQVRMPRWFKGRIALTGDAAWSPTPLSGIGTTLAIVGAYVLAGELAKDKSSNESFASYEKIMRPFVKKGQNIPKLIPRLLWPHTKLDLALLRSGMKFLSSPMLKKTILQFFARDPEVLKLPIYEDIESTF